MTPQEVQELIQRYLADANAENATGTHRGLVLVWASIIDDVLMRMLNEHFVALNPRQRDALFGPNGPLNEFSSRTKMLRALGILHSDEVAVIDDLRRIRNKFAHALGISLNEPELSLQCNNFGNTMTGEMGIGDPKLKFSGGCGSLLMLLINRLSRITRAAGLPDTRELPERAYGTPDGNGGGPL
ncbi:hypothetical protein QTA58_22720 [Neorhizobium sp. CSC1952]|uniref:hypothetical protein n=1 Tax=Neorhizobium sp. CSC1952 TaxID=2978974 RepID=UPI0025A5F55F|nr:hypothetical protein [Rhizobium sp. CSC1952]WJR66969.1 hypothetical protein QTA58_22720 [Rhizobium sp. CSC1952]